LLEANCDDKKKTKTKNNALVRRQPTGPITSNPKEQSIANKDNQKHREAVETVSESSE
jgi:hypothetical protein